MSIVVLFLSHSRGIRFLCVESKTLNKRQKVAMPKRTHKQELEEGLYREAFQKILKLGAKDQKSVNKIEKRLEWDVYEVRTTN
jgi:hypothetical protein